MSGIIWNGKTPGRTVGYVSEQLSNLSPRLTQPHQSPSSVPATPTQTQIIMSVPSFTQLARPEKFLGEIRDSCSFLVQREMHFELQPQQFLTECVKIAFLISHLTGRAEAWATAEGSRGTEICESYFDFSQAFCQVFQSFSPGQEAAHTLRNLHQGRRSIMDYTIKNPSHVLTTSSFL